MLYSMDQTSDSTLPPAVIGLLQGWTIAGKEKDLDLVSKSLLSMERETGFEPATLSLEG